MGKFAVATPLIQAINAGVPAVGHAPLDDGTTDQKYPDKLITARAPWVLTYPGTGSTEEVAKGLFCDKREWVVEAYYAPVGDRINNQAARRATASLLSDLKDAWHALSNTEAHNLDYGDVSGFRIAFMRSDPIRDTGPLAEMVFDDLNVKWWGFQMYLPISIQWGPSVC